MLDFKPAVLEDKSWVDKIVFSENYPGAEYNFGNMYIWKNLYLPSICRFEERLMIRLCSGNGCVLVYPIGTGPLRPAVDALREYAKSQNVPFSLTGVGAGHMELLEQEYPGCFEFIPDRSRFDYIYKIEKLAEFPGKALHGKRNHCNRFEAEHDWEFVPLSSSLIPECLEFMENWLMENALRLDQSVSHELDALMRAMDHFDTLNMEGGVLFAEGEMLGFTLGELCADNCFDVHFEKAKGEINGAYTMVCRELARMLQKNHPKLEYINREEDMGLEALRFSKLSYKPEFLLEKYTARWRE